MAPVLTQPDREVWPPPSPSELELGVIKDARRRQRRRWLAVVAAVVGAGAAAIIIGSGGGRGSTQSAGSRASTRPGAGAIFSPAKVFAQDPYMGVSCGSPNSIACDRVGLAVWLRRPAIVTATIAGAPLTLNAPHWTYVAHDSRGALYVYAGFLQPAGITTRLHVKPDAGSPSTWGANLQVPAALPPLPAVRFRIDYGFGDVVFTQKHVWLSMGWG